VKVRRAWERMIRDKAERCDGMPQQSDVLQATAEGRLVTLSDDHHARIQLCLQGGERTYVQLRRGAREPYK